MRPTLAAAALLTLALSQSARAAEVQSAAGTSHVVRPGQTLYQIARDYGISLDALCRANGIQQNTPIQPKQKLKIPAPLGGSARDEIEPAADTSVANPPARAPKLTARDTELTARAPKLTARDTELTARDPKLTARDIELTARDPNPGSAPAQVDQAAPQRRAQRNAEGGAKDAASAGKPPKRRSKAQRRSDPEDPYARKPLRSGYIKLSSFVGRWEGSVFDKKGAITPAARIGMSRVLASWRTGERAAISDELIRLLVKVSDHFGGRPVRIVSGYRPKSPTQFTEHSQHNLGRAVDFSIPGVPNEVVRDYCRRFSKAGVGYYPNSSFVHLDARGYPSYWIDYSGPGQRPRYAHERTRNAQLAPTTTDNVATDTPINTDIVPAFVEEPEQNLGQTRPSESSGRISQSARWRGSMTTQ